MNEYRRYSLRRYTLLDPPPTDPEEEESALQGALYVPGVDLSAVTEEARRELQWTVRKLL